MAIKQKKRKIKKLKDKNILAVIGGDNYLVKDCPVLIPKCNYPIFHWMQKNAQKEPYKNMSQYDNTFKTYCIGKDGRLVVEAVMRGVRKALNESVANNTSKFENAYAKLNRADLFSYYDSDWKEYCSMINDI